MAEKIRLAYSNTTSPSIIAFGTTLQVRHLTSRHVTRRRRVNDAGGKHVDDVHWKAKAGQSANNRSAFLSFCNATIARTLMARIYPFIEPRRGTKRLVGFWNSPVRGVEGGGKPLSKSTNYHYSFVRSPLLQHCVGPECFCGRSLRECFVWATATCRRTVGYKSCSVPPQPSESLHISHSTSLTTELTMRLSTLVSLAVAIVSASSAVHASVLNSRQPNPDGVIVSK